MLGVEKRFRGTRVETAGLVSWRTIGVREIRHGKRPILARRRCRVDDARVLPGGGRRWRGGRPALRLTPTRERSSRRGKERHTERPIRLRPEECGGEPPRSGVPRLDSSGLRNRVSALPIEASVANHPSAEKRNRQRIKRTLRNRAIKSAVRSQVKTVRAAIAAKDPKAAAAALAQATVALDRAAGKGAVERKAASRTVSRLAAQVHKLSAG